ncbi:MAG: protein-export chaperone SecB [Hyphomicrobiales bacterium]
MSDTSASDQPAAAGNGDGEQKPPQINIIAQYIKDLSFENPKAPDSLRPREGGPNISINVNVNANPMSETDFEVDLKLESKATHEDDVLFNIELAYSGIFRLANVPKEHLHPLIMIECPRLLFPFARQIVASATRDGGFPPLLIDPVDFAALYRQRLEQIQAQQKAEGQPN